MRPLLRVFVAVLIATFVAVLSPLSAQADTPASWGNATLITPNIGTNRFVAQSNGTTLMVWTESSGLYSSTSANDGQTWSQPTLIFSINPSFSGLDMTALPAGGFAIVLSEFQTNRVLLYTSNISGSTWSLVGAQTVTEPDSVSITPVGTDRVAISANIRISSSRVVHVSVSDAGIHSFSTFTPVSTPGTNATQPEIASTSGSIAVVWQAQTGQLGTSTSTDSGATWSSVSLTNFGITPSRIGIITCNGQFVTTAWQNNGSPALKVVASPPSNSLTWSTVMSSQAPQSPFGFSTVCTTDNKLVTAFANTAQTNAFWATSSLVAGTWSSATFATVPGSIANNLVLASAARGQVALLSHTSVYFGTSSIYAQFLDPTTGWSTPVLVQQSQDLPAALLGVQTQSGAALSWSFETNDGLDSPNGNITSLSFTSAIIQPAPSDELAKTGVSLPGTLPQFITGLALLCLAMGLVLLKTRRKH